MKNNFPFRPHWKKPEEPKAAPETSQYLPRAVELTVEQHKPEEGLRVLLEGFAHYFNCTAEAFLPGPGGRPDGRANRKSCKAAARRLLRDQQEIKMEEHT